VWVPRVWPSLHFCFSSLSPFSKFASCAGRSAFGASIRCLCNDFPRYIVAPNLMVISLRSLHLRWFPMSRRTVTSRFVRCCAEMTSRRQSPFTISFFVTAILNFIHQSDLLIMDWLLECILRDIQTCISCFGAFEIRSAARKSNRLVCVMAIRMRW
jgi:hypothetical protein